MTGRSGMPGAHDFRLFSLRRFVGKNGLDVVPANATVGKIIVSWNLWAC